MGSRSGPALASLVAILAALLLVRPVRGEVPGQAVATSTPTPTTVTPSPTATLPAAKALLAQAGKAFIAAGSAHLGATFTLSVSGTGSTTSGLGGSAKLNGTMDGDVSWKKPQQAHLAGTLTMSSAMVSQQNVTFELVLTNKVLATRTNGQAWSCVPVKSLTRALGLSKTKGPAVAPKGGANVKVKTKLANLGAGSVNGVAVWHLRETAVMKSKATKGVPASTERVREDFYISQADSTLQGIFLAVRGKSGSTKVKMAMNLTFSMYGETVQVTPPTCSSTFPGVALRTSLQPERVLLHPEALLHPFASDIRQFQWGGV